MASTIITKNSSTASAIPAVGDLTKGELAVNVTDKKVYTKDNSAAIVKIVGSLGNQEANAVAITGGSIVGITDLAVADGGTGASTASDARTNLGLGTIATQAASSVTITGGSVTGITDITVADGGTGASTAANARSNLGAAASGANSDITSLSGLTTALSVAQGGTGITSLGTGVATFLGTPSSANLLAAVTDETGTGALVFANTPTLVAPILGTPTSGNFSSGSFTWPTFNQNTTGTAAGLSSTLAIASGGTGATTAGGALTSLGAYAASNPSGYTTNTGTVTSVGGTGTVNGLTLTGTVTTSGNLTLGGTLSGVSLTSQVTGTLPTANGGTNLTSFTSGGVVYASSSSALATGSALTFDGQTLQNSRTNPIFNLNDTTFAVGLRMISTGGVNYIQSGVPSSSFADLAFTTNLGGSELMRLTSTGLGIGTSSPTEKLTLGDGTVSNTIAISINGGSNSSKGAFISFKRASSEKGVIGTVSGFIGGTSSDMGYFASSGLGHQFFVNGSGTASAVLDSAGNLGLGVTPSAWSGYTAFDIARGSLFGSGSETYLSHNAFWNGSSWRYKATDFATNYRSNNGTHAWSTAPSGTAGDAISFTQAMTLAADGNLGLGATTTAGGRLVITQSNATQPAIYLPTDESTIQGPNTNTKILMGGNLGLNGNGLVGINAVGGSAIITLATANTERARIDSSGNLLVGTTSQIGAEKFGVDSGSSAAGKFKGGNAANVSLDIWNPATSGDNIFVAFRSETSETTRGTITFNRGTGLVVYGTTSDYRAKDISGPVTNSGALIDSVPVYMGTMKGATQERPMFIAHETPAYAHIGVKDAVDADGNPVYQQMDASALIPVMWAEIQSLRQRLSAANL